eukprot:1096385-Prymnesium_polylepis.2
MCLLLPSCKLYPATGTRHARVLRAARTRHTNMARVWDARTTRAGSHAAITHKAGVLTRYEDAAH